MKRLELSTGLKGQKRALQQLNRILERGKVAHAYLFLGPGGVGKAQVGLAMARILLETEKESHPDLFILERQGATIRIAEVRQLQEWFIYKPYISKRRVAVIPEAHLMSNDAANALLKLLEEPAGEVVLILTADRETLPSTIVSRCQVVRFQALSTIEVEEILLQHGMEAEKAVQLSLLCEGSPGRALNMAEVDLSMVMELAVKFLQDLSQGETLIAYEIAEKFDKKGLTREVFLTVLEVFFRDALLYVKGLTNQMLLLPIEMAEQIAPVEGLAQILRSIGKTRQILSRNANPLLGQVKLYLEIADVLKEGC